MHSAKKDIWKVSSADQNIAGYAKCVTVLSDKGNRFCYAVVRNAGHETPAYQPRSAYDMTRRFLDGEPFDASGESSSIPTCAQCGGVGPFAGLSLPECN